MVCSKVRVCEQVHTHRHVVDGPHTISGHSVPTAKYLQIRIEKNESETDTKKYLIEVVSVKVVSDVRENGNPQIRLDPKALGERAIAKERRREEERIEKRREREREAEYGVSQCRE